MLYAGLPWAASGAGVRKRLGVYVHVDVGDAIGSYPGSKPTLAQLHSYLQSLYAKLLADPAVSGITLGAHWDQTQPTNGNSPSSYDWSYLDDAFAAAAAAQKTVQLIITPGFDSPPWLLAEIPSCDPLFTAGSAPSNCGTVTFVGYPEAQRSDGNVLPLPWNSVYQAAWGAFLTSLNARYSSNSAFVSIAIAGPVGASDEMIFPTSENDAAAQPSGLTVDATWAALIQHSFPSNSAYQNTDQALIDAWKQAIDAAEAIFTGVTLFIGADAGNDFPNFSQTVTPHPDNTLFAQDCSKSPKTEIMSCEAKTEVLSYFVTVAGSNEKGTQVGGMTASSAVTVGDIGVQGVKVLTALSPSFVGGAEFDQPVSGPSTLQSEGCPNPNGGCTGLSVEEAAYNVMTVFFTGTPAAEFYGGTVGTAPMQYLEVPFNDLLYAFANPCPAAPSSTLGYLSLQDLYARASLDLLAMANQASSLPPLTCPLSASAPLPTIPSGGIVPRVVQPGEWVSIYGTNLADSTANWTGNFPTSLGGSSVTIDGKAAYLSFAGPGQINLQVPNDTATGPVPVVVTTANGSGTSTVTLAQFGPVFFLQPDGKHVAGIIPGPNGAYSTIGPSGNSLGYPTVAAKAGDMVELFGTGFGPTSPAVPAGQTFSGAAPTTNPVTILINKVSVTPSFAGLAGAGLYQINVTIPSGLGTGDVALQASVGGAVQTLPGVVISLQ